MLILMTKQTLSCLQWTWTFLSSGIMRHQMGLENGPASALFLPLGAQGQSSICATDRLPGLELESDFLLCDFRQPLHRCVPSSLTFVLALPDVMGTFFGIQ